MSGIGITYRGMVHQWHCDHMGHMNVMWYVGKFDEATWNLASLMGMTSQYMRETQRGMVAVDQRIAYKREALAGDVLIVRSAVLALKSKSIRFVHEMFRADTGDHLATTLLTGVHIDSQGRKSTEFEPQVFSRSQSMISAEPERWDAWPPEKAYLE
ncbi:MAG: thioesterase family protein [Pseudomonadota bacterium]